ncbi:hypothetical protein EKL29_10415 [Pantoea sp. YU22]|uniref:hypothetical protein n=1 Tax=Pantoea sp. YU22 TaxID=2497684 RepID=UPI000F85C97F|nr:hypothetical protein [Pantoea sp. YU22]RTY57983.1 hypothetical protein EKL29_10415 [Pantoea sp. YU22]
MSQFLHLLDRPVAFQRSFVRLGAGVTGALLLSQLVYWQNRMDGKWFYKTQVELEEETGLSRYEQEGARKKLVSVGVLEEQKKGIPAKLYFRVNEIALSEFLLPKNQQAGMGNSCNQGCGNSANSDAENQQAGMGNFPDPVCGNSASIHTVDYTETTTEITSETTSDGTPAKAAEPSRNAKQDYSPEFEEAWQAYPKRSGGNPKPSAWKAWSARIREGVKPSDMLAGVQRYASYVTATGKANSEYVKQASTFFGPDHHFAESWTAPASQQRSTPAQSRHSGFSERDYGTTTTPYWAKGASE